jgi:hypothetical protein
LAAFVTTPPIFSVCCPRVSAGAYSRFAFADAEGRISGSALRPTGCSRFRAAPGRKPSRPLLAVAQVGWSEPEQPKCRAAVRSSRALVGSSWLEILAVIMAVEEGRGGMPPKGRWGVGGDGSVGVPMSRGDGATGVVRPSLVLGGATAVGDQRISRLMITRIRVL